MLTRMMGKLQAGNRRRGKGLVIMDKGRLD